MSVLIFLVVVFLGFPLAVILATPTQHLKFYLLWLAMLAVLALVWPGGADHSRFAGLGEALEAFFLGAWTFFVVAKIAIVQARRLVRSGTVKDTDSPRDTSDGFALVLAGLSGLFAAPWSMFLVALMFSAGSSAALAHGSTSIVLIAAAALLVKSRDSTNETMQTFAGALLGAAIITLVMAAIYVNSRTAAVIDRAEIAANGHPYCIQIDTTSSGYRPVVARLDLSPLMMRARCSQGWCFSRHAVLTIDDEHGRMPMYWSYGHDGFQEEGIRSGIMDYSAPTVCAAVRDFARRLPLF